MVHVARRNGASHMQLIEHVARKGELLKIDDLNLYSLRRSNISYFEVENVLTLRVELTISCPLSLPHCFLVLDFCLFLLLYDSFDPSCSELSKKSIDTGVGIDRKAVVKLKKFISGVLVGLNEGKVSDRVHDIDFIL